MSIPKVVLVASLSLFIIIGVLAFFKKSPTNNAQEVVTNSYEKVVVPIQSDEIVQIENPSKGLLTPVVDDIASQEVDEVWRLFTTGKQKLPIVETIKYQSRVSWLNGRPAWITDYATHYSTSRHFIARSLNGNLDYFTQKVSTGDHFNVFKIDKTIHFHLLLDLSRCKMWFYYHDVDTNERVLIKTYKVGLGRFDTNAESGILTPKGKFTLGQKVAIYKPGVMGYFHEEEAEMVQAFGTRWIPFYEELSGEGRSASGYGIHGAPWIYDAETKTYKENLETIGQYDSDGCIRLGQEDMEELFSIVLTKPTMLHIVTDFREAELPGIEG